MQAARSRLERQARTRAQSLAAEQARERDLLGQCGDGDGDGDDDTQFASRLLAGVLAVELGSLDGQPAVVQLHVAVGNLVAIKWYLRRHPAVLALGLEDGLEVDHHGDFGSLRSTSVWEQTKALVDAAHCRTRGEANGGSGETWQVLHGREERGEVRRPQLGR